jgi:tetratricopeptide (TPR) repeat protein
MTHKIRRQLSSLLLLTLFLLVASAARAQPQPPPPRDAAGLFARAVERQRAGSLAEAIEDYRQALKLRPDLLAAHVNLALAYVQLKRTDEAVTSLKEALRLRPDHELARDRVRITRERIEYVKHLDELKAAAERATASARASSSTSSKTSTPTLPRCSGGMWKSRVDGAAYLTAGARRLRRPRSSRPTS